MRNTDHSPSLNVATAAAAAAAADGGDDDDAGPSMH